MITGIQINRRLEKSNTIFNKHSSCILTDYNYIQPYVKKSKSPHAIDEYFFWHSFWIWSKHEKEKISFHISESHYSSFIDIIMKTKLANLLMVLFLTTTIQLSAQRRVTVEAINNDISYSLDLKAVASIFGDSRTLEDFERRLNDYDAQISNLDLNSDGEIDYLRVIETSENNLHLIVIQAILDERYFRDVATIVVERDRNRRTYVQVIGDPYMYGYNYIIEPVYLRLHVSFSWFWTRDINVGIHLYYWGYYPRHYHHRRPIEINLYLTHINHPTSIIDTTTVILKTLETNKLTDYGIRF